ncbi:RlpA-like double-psi beta-barrel-protein domain-containing protein-containing protein [Mycena haematopus]|nr:RlpA-like double-psi beta-barrel-protein domain-containing protein-containing protein [Mycena haematopus]
MRSVTTLLPLALPLVLATHQPNLNHRELAKRARGDLEKRDFTNARWTFYSTGLGACGGYNSDSDFIVALNQDTFGYSYPGQYCYKKINMSYNGKSTTATIVDSCPGCPSPGGLDLSPGLFSFFASQDLGVIQGTWSFADDSDNPPPPTTTKKTTTHHTTTSTTTHTTPTTTSHTTPTTTTTHTKATPTSSSSSKSSSSATPSSTTASSAVPSSTVTVEGGLADASGTVASNSGPENLGEFSQAFLGLAGLVVAGADHE